MAFPKGLLSDLGGVIVPWVGLIELSHITGKCEAEIKAVMGASAFFGAFETGQIGIDEFAPRFIKALLGLDNAPENFAALWNSWVLPPYKGTREAMLKLGQKYKVAC